MDELRWILLAAGLVLIAGIYYFGMRARQRSAPPVERTVRVEPPPVSPAPVPAHEPEPEGPRIEPSLSPVEGFDAQPEPDEPTIDFDEPAVTRGYGRREPTIGTEPVVVQRPAPPPTVEPVAVPEVKSARPPESAPAPAPRPQQRIVAVRVVAASPLRFEGARLLEVIRSEGLEFGRYDIFHSLHTDGRPVFSLASLREPGTFELESVPTSTYPGIALFAVLPGPLAAVETFDQLIFSARAFAAQLGGTLADERGAPLTVHRISRLREEMLAFDRHEGGGDAG